MSLGVGDAGFSYGGVPVFADLSFTADPGEAVAVVGPNGSGKSTLLRCLVGAEVLESGSVLFGGAELDESSGEFRSAVASLLDDADYFPDVSVVEHLRLLAWLHGAPADVLTVLGEVGLGAVADQLPPTLSSGQRHRLGLASCFVRPRSVLVLDEPEQRLDAAGRSWLRSRLLAEKAAGVAVVFASHDQELVEAVACRTVTL
ncbi:ABC transporter ATP-binding protein [Lentzea flaviverrucosa]|uniref:ABC transporter n=1 Tax=Lentzea flaviverrucosa TaxID=200379 RepID=A0A1H9FQR5_9PSEU|nr:ABC transporter ATP-binding protein [Lentzea flaviverrucosa]RDI35141.1 ABC transporter family protein [Lentzea flaviverrucosa]SEQ39768.1 ABC transporter [Lentzea flaviverrucosa]